jgi:broad specificity phosphatase PhoE
MTRVYLVRHGRAAAGWDTDPDPALDDQGRAQALAVTAHLRPLGPLHLVTSPLLRCRQTAFPLETVWGIEAVVEPAVAEIPSPDGVAMADRVEWLKDVMHGSWAALGPRYTDYRDLVVATVAGMPADTVICSHFVAINAVIGAALGDDRLVIRSLDNCSVTVVEVAADGGLRLVEGGHEADTLIR